MKMDEPFVVPLVPEVVELLKALPRASGDFVFSTTHGQKPISGFSKMKLRLDDLMAEELGKELQPWCLHDIRRTFRTNLSALPDVTEEIRERLLAHAQDALSEAYDRYDYLDEKRRALELWTARFFGMVKPAG